MGLLAWYPLNGNLDDYSGSNNSVLSSSGVTWGSGGKMEKCYTPNGTSYIRIQNPIKSLTKFTICFWMKESESDTWSNIFTITDGTSSNSCRVEKTSTTGDYRWYIDGCFTSGVMLFQNNINTWQHVVLKSDGVNVYCYVNGVQTYTSKINSVNKLPNLPYIHIAMRDTASKWKGYLNDLRFYDEALSLKEIKEIAKAKTLHYNFNHFAEPTENLYVSKGFHNTSMGAWGTSIITYTTKQNYFENGVYKQRLVYSTGDKGYSTSSTDTMQGIGLISGTADTSSTYGGRTFAFKVKIHNKSLCNIIAKGNGYIADKTFKPNEIGYYSGVFTIGYSHFQFTIHTPFNQTNCEVIISEAQLEEKKYCTPYTPNKRLTDTITDSSGFRNHSQQLTLTTSPQWIEDGVIGRGCYKFNGTSNVIQSGYNPNQDNFTISFWAREQEIRSNYFAWKTNSILIHLNTSYIRMRVFGTDWSTEVKYLTTRTANKWYHYTFSFDNGVQKIYLNGSLVAIGDANTTTIAQNSNPFCIGKRTDSNEYFKGDIDDIRVYATTLSDEAIKEIYQSRGSVSKNGKLMVNEIVENGNYKYESQGVNLVRNGYGEYKDNTNMGGTFISTDFTPESNGCFEYTGKGTIISSDYIKVNKQDTYKLSMYIKSMTENNKFYAGIACYDENKNFINHVQVNRVQSSCTTLAKPLNTGDTVVYLTSSSGWYVGTQGTYVHQKQLGVFNRLDATNYERTTTLIKYTNIDTTAHTLTLQSAWTGATIPQGTKVANSYDGGVYNYILASYETPQMNWYKKEVKVSGWGTRNESKFRYGTEYIKILILVNYAQASTFKMRVGSISFINTSQLQSPEYNSKDNSQVNKRGQLFTTEIYENNYKPSLVDYSGWSLTSTDGWSNNGTSSENCRVIYPNPRGNSDIMWATITNDTTSNDDGGFHSPMVNIDKTKKYRFSVWIRRENIGDGRTYFGLNAYDSSGTENGLLNLSDTSITNPYFTNFAKGHAFYDACNNEWCLFVAYVQPSSYSGDNEAENGVYKKDGTRVGGVSGYKWSTTASKARLRAYLYYSTSTAERQYFYRPRIDLCDGSEPTIQELLSCNEHLPLVDMNGKPIPKNIFSFAKDGRTYSTEFIEN